MMVISRRCRYLEKGGLSSSLFAQLAFVESLAKFDTQESLGKNFKKYKFQDLRKQEEKYCNDMFWIPQKATLVDTDITIFHYPKHAVAGFLFMRTCPEDANF